MRRSCFARSNSHGDLEGRNRAEGAKDSGQRDRRRCMTRRSFVLSAAIAAGMLLWRPRTAFADEPWWDDSLLFRGYGKKYSSKFWTEVGKLEAGNGGAQSGPLYTDRWVSAKTPWVEWDISSNQYLRTASKITMRCDFTTELYYHLTGLLEIACGSYNGSNASYNLWHTDSGDDTRFSLYHAIDDYPKGGKLEESKVVAIDNEAGSGIHKNGAHIWTDYRRYPQNSYSIWVRRQQKAVKHSFQLRSWFWNYYYFGTDWYFDRSSDPPIGYSTKWVELLSDKIAISSNAVWANRVVTLTSRARKGLCLESSNNPSSGIQCAVSPSVQATKQHWMVLESEHPDVEGTYRFVPVTSLDGAHQLDQYGGGPRMSASSAQLWGSFGSQLNRAQVFWIHGSASTQWIFADCSGMALDCGGKTGLAQFHSDGYPSGEWGNTEHMWYMQDALFSTTDGKPFLLEANIEDDCVPAGESVSVPDPVAAFRPGGSALQARGIRYGYTWVITEDDCSAVGYPEVIGSAYVLEGGWQGDQPAVNIVGVAQRNYRLGGLSLRIEGGSLSGSVSVRLRSGGVWRDGTVAGAAADAVSLSLVGAVSQYFEVAYRACSPKAGWGAWSTESKAASGPGKDISGVQVRLEPKGIVAKGDVSTLVLDDAWSGKYLTCVVRAETEYQRVPYRGAALSQTVQVGKPVTLIQFVVDDDSAPCFEERIEAGTAYRTPWQAVEAGKKDGCSDFDGWYIDKDCKDLFEEGSVVDGRKLVLYGRSIASISYELTERTRRLFSERRCYEDESMAKEIDEKLLVPPGESVRYGTRLKFKRRESVWYEDRGRAREAANVQGAFLDAKEESSSVEALKITSDVKLYLAWHPPCYEGIEVS